MATLSSIIHALRAASVAISPQTLITPSSPEFISTDAITIPAGGFSAVYAFGDSLSDAGNVSIGTLGAVPVSPPYSDGRFTNGNVWVQDLAQNLGLPPVAPSLAGGTDYAYGGAETGTTAVHTANPTDLPSQLAQFIANVPDPSPTALYAVWAGSNDVLDIVDATTLTPAQQQAAVAQAVANETTFIQGLIADGAKDIVVMNVPDIGKSPQELVSPATSALASSLSLDYNNDLAASLQQIMATGAASIDLINTYSLLDQVIADPARYGFSNVTQPVWTGNLTNPDSGVLAATGAAQNNYLFFDGLHPTAAAHTVLAEDVTQVLLHPPASTI